MKPKTGDIFYTADLSDGVVKLEVIRGPDVEGKVEVLRTLPSNRAYRDSIYLAALKETPEEAYELLEKDNERLLKQLFRTFAKRDISLQTWVLERERGVGWDSDED